MNKLNFVISVLFLIGFLQSTNAQPTKGIPSSTIEVHQWIAQHFAKGKVPPFSFLYGGKSSNNFIKNWQFSVEKLKSVEPNMKKQFIPGPISRAALP